MLAGSACRPLSTLMSAHHYQLTTSDDVNDHAASLSRWDQQYEQVSAGRFQGRLEELWLGPVQVFRESTGRAVLQRGAPAPHTLTLATPAGSGPNEGWFCGRHIGAGQTFGLVAQGEFELATRGAFDIVAISVHRDQLCAHAQAQGHQRAAAPLPGQLAHNQVLGGGPQADAPLRQLLLAALEAARGTPQLLAQPAARRAMTDALCDALLGRIGLSRPLAGGVPDAGVPALTAATRQRVVREARRYMQAHADAPITVPDLCAAIHVSRRALQYSFQDVLQMSPVAYLRALRLNGVRRALRQGGDEPVADRAARWGFWHQSRFAADYRQLFGELPSETLRQARTATALH